MCANRIGTKEAEANAALIVKAVNERAELIAALRRIANINNGPDRASGEWRCQEAAAIAKAALAKADAP